MFAESSMAVQVAMALPHSTHCMWSRSRLICPTPYVSFLCRRKRPYPALTSMSTWRTVRLNLNPQPLRFHARGMRSHSIEFGRSFSPCGPCRSRSPVSSVAPSRFSWCSQGRATRASAACEHRPWSLHWTSRAWQKSDQFSWRYSILGFPPIWFDKYRR
ncbi:hypothetical protein BC826DRAFT_352030 [Russula brevipes]|nr:hypothetical protein BC826DRAFT_352030 [Russula brevipes]